MLKTQQKVVVICDGFSDSHRSSIKIRKGLITGFTENMIRLGFIGGGFVAQQVHLPCFNANKNFKIVGLADPLHDLCSQVASQYGIEHTYTNHKILLENEEIDAVVITLPRRLTYNVVKDSLDACKHVMTEKPICLSIENGKRLIELSEKYKRIVKVGYNKEHDSGTKKFKELYEFNSSDIKLIRAYSYMGDSYCSPFGDIKSILKQELTKCSPLEEYPSWLSAEKHWAYEQFLNVHSHIMHACEYICSSKIKIESIYCNDNAEGIFSGKVDNTPFSLEAVRGSQLKWTEGISFKSGDTECEIKYGPPFLRNSPATVHTTSGSAENICQEYKPDWSWSFMNQVQHFYDLIEAPFSVDNLTRAVRQVKLAEQIFQMKPLKKNG